MVKPDDDKEDQADQSEAESDFFTNDKHLVSGVALRIQFLRSHNLFCIIADGANKNYKIRITEANMFVRKMVVNETVVTAVEKTLLKTHAMYKYTETITKSFLATARHTTWKYEDVFNREPIKRFALAMCNNAAFVGSEQTNPFYYRKFNLSQITIYRDGYAVAGTPISTTNNKRVYMQSLSALGFENSGHEIPLSEYSDHYVLVFDLTSTQQASHNYIHPESTNAPITIELIFSAPLADNTEVFLLGEKQQFM